MQLKQSNIRASSKNEILDDDDIEAEADIKEDKEIDNTLDDNNNFDDDFYGDTSSPSNMQKYNDMLKDLTGLNPDLIEKAKGWLGLYFNEEKQKFERNPMVTPLMNEKGVNWCITFIKNYVAKHHFLTNISEDEYKWEYIDVSRVLFTDFAVIDDFGIRNEADRHRICIELRDCIMLFLTGAGGGKYTEFFGSSTMRTEHVNMQPNQMQMMQPALYQPQKKPGLIKSALKMLTGGK